ncbi:MAG: hypothetical protein ACFFCS_06565 [Candidatus Hodarchaeota archaeon]
MITRGESFTKVLTSRVMVDEPVLFFKEDRVLSGTLLFPPSKIRAIKIWQEKEGCFEEVSLDCLEETTDGLRTILQTSVGTLPFIPKDILVRPLGSPNSYPSTMDGKNGLLFSEDGMFHKLQVRVTYEHDEAWDGCLPAVRGNALPKTRKAIEEGGNIDFFIIGDSISAGCNCSKMLGLSPF